MLATPAAELAGGVEPGVGVDEGGPGAVAGNGKLPGEVARGDAGPAGVDAAGQEGRIDPEVGEVADLVLLGREPGQVGGFEDGVEGEKPAPENGVGGPAAVAQVLDAQGSVEGPGVDVAELLVGSAARERRLAGNPFVGQAPEEAEGRHARALVVVAELRAEEDAAVETDERDPFRVAAGPAEGHQRLGASGEVGGGAGRHGF